MPVLALLGGLFIWPARAFTVTPTAGGIRVGGTVEMAGLDAAPDYRRSKITVRQAQTALPNLRCENFSEWMGHRPAMPDTVPVVSASAKVQGVFYATGHGHLGVTYAATTARLMLNRRRRQIREVLISIPKRIEQLESIPEDCRPAILAEVKRVMRELFDDIAAWKLPPPKG